jgi:hypothetical protein
MKVVGLRFYTTELRCEAIMRLNSNERRCNLITSFGLIIIYFVCK